jgi:hypothetical protein
MALFLCFHFRDSDPYVGVFESGSWGSVIEFGLGSFKLPWNLDERFDILIFKFLVGHQVSTVAFSYATVKV